MAKRKLAGPCMAIAVTTAYLVGSPAARAQPDDVTVEISRCVDLKSPEERRACYGAQVDAAIQERERSAASAAAPATPAPANAAPDTARSAAEPIRPQRARRDGGADQPTADQPTIVAKIAELRETVPNSYLITLDNGQVWRQSRSKWHPLRIGQGVRILPTGWGKSFRLFGDGLSGYIQVEQVR